MHVCVRQCPGRSRAGLFLFLELLPASFFLAKPEVMLPDGFRVWMRCGCFHAARFHHVDTVKNGPREQSGRKKRQLSHRFTLPAVCEEAAVHLIDVLEWTSHRGLWANESAILDKLVSISSEFSTLWQLVRWPLLDATSLCQTSLKQLFCGSFYVASLCKKPRAKQTKAIIYSSHHLQSSPLV